MTQEQLQEQYSQILQSAAAIQVTGSGMGETLSIPGGGSISASNLLNQVKTEMAPILVNHNIREIDTSPISETNAQGLASSHEPGKIHVDVSKLFNSARQMLSSTTQLDGMQADPDAFKSVVNNIIVYLTNWLHGELTETIGHESQHRKQFEEAVVNVHGPLNLNVPEAPAESFGRQQRQRFVQPFQRSLSY